MNTLLLMRHVLVHPIDFYYEIQNPKRIAWFQAMLLIALVFAVRMASILATGYAFETREPYEISWVYELVWIVVPWLAYCICNWAVSTIMDGEGKFKEIIVGSAFALVPFILFTIPVTLLTQILSLQESGIFTALTRLILVWCAWLLLVKIKVLHDFELGKLALISLLSFISMAILLFVCILLFGLINQFFNFVADIAQEMRLRS
ncbi:NHL repeat containing protein [Paenibacillus pasadenensis]|uniref:NHL repeat containing protein n=1 Tax=Paenibacillus pasadenensis TaxID=217090 RepID=A0A2N5N7Z2_9BACL|nr:Yip1 family protein [Paenibacillus pasadenensis]PLT46471.1 NHL repeat containing protein [Paenibacillus pasadenensis]